MFATLKRRLIAEMARIAATLHAARLFHKDLYLCHFFLDLDRLERDGRTIRLVLIDLHRLSSRRLVAGLAAMEGPGPVALSRPSVWRHR